MVRIINEPTAAALAYGLGKNLRERVLVYDLGGGTFDVSIIDIRDRVFEVKATAGDIFLGGIDFDNALIAYVLADFRRKHGVDLSSDPVAMQRIKDLAERTKIDLSSRAEAPFSIPFITMTPQGQPLNIDMRVDRALLEQLTEPLLDRSMEILARVLTDAGMSTGEIDKVMLVGGQTRMPAIQERLTTFFGRPPSKGVHPDEAVAIGAALYGWSLVAGGEQRLQLLDVIPMAIGIEQAGGGTHVVFGRNAGIPNARAISATNSRSGQTELVLRIVQGDHPEAARNETLGEFTFSGVRPGPAGEVRLEILFEVNVEGILSVHARDLDTGREMKTTVRVTQSLIAARSSGRRAARYADFFSFSKESSGGSRRRITPSVILHSLTPSRYGTSYMMSSMACSRIERRPRAPDLRRMASRAVARSASFVKESFTFSSSKSFWYCFTSALLGWVRMVTRSSSVSSESVAMMGMRPTNSGMSPNFTRSCGSMWASSSPERGLLARLDAWPRSPAPSPPPGGGWPARCRRRRRPR